MTNPVSATLEDGIFIVTIDNPPVNAASEAVRAGLAQAASQFAADRSAKAMLIVAAGRTFVAGADIREFGKPLSGLALPDVVGRIEALDRPVICVIHGTALGGGLEIALGCHYRLMLKSAKIGLPEVAIGLLPGAGGTQRLPRLVGIEQATEIITSGRQIGAAEAAALGIVDQVSDNPDPKSAGLAFTREILAAGRPVRRTSEREEKLAADRARPDLIATLRKSVEAKARGQISPVRALDAIALSLDTPFAEAMQKERAMFMELLASDQSKALIHAFFSERAVSRIPEQESGRPREIRTAGVIGGGTMGSGIALSMLLAGIPVTMVERDEEGAARGRANVEKVLDEGVARGRYDLTRRNRLAHDLFRVSTDFSALREADLIIEAAFEDMEIKKDVFRRLDQVAKAGATLASNTSYLDIDAIASVTNRPADVLGLHFFSPAHIMKLLEIVVAKNTSADTAMTGFALAKALGKTGVRAGVCDGFIGNRILERYLRLAATMVEDGTSPYAIDRAVVGFGYPMGPHQMGDLAGLDIGWLARKRRIAEGYKGRYAFDYLDRLAEMKRLGQKTGRGCYIYPEGARKGEEDPEFLALIEEIRKEKAIAVRPALSEAEIIRRYLAIMINEGARVVEEGIALRPLDVDMVMLAGYGFPRWRGGPMHYVDSIGLAKVLADLEEFAAEDQEFYKPADLLVELVRKGQTFASLNDRS
ncbi:3-hydroxyacyl-CoA dehydrogenase NAD-binding domain-containing protein [Rhizobium alvei]|uniref:3-hydroxyacyl-CoA dehydrogenase NAD-binding domain-containing protein n=1 Tax=Rhizobium alvei TaxID=1132659 RepID=A0ABT8YH56_9HYPH|nr:3-hydroxyacyl-CoA dehydrogenase NAD-binding domain-containing protein [Rhizobium alvei]MDO6963003.1 3-hydroxyacyl-CoA dehydrogenase NAD-binding domain-containing protein [Rhizobium alvei]